MCHFPDRKTNISHTHTHTTRHTHTLQQGLTLCALLPTPWKSQPFHTEKVVCVIVPHKTHCWYWADSLQAQNEVDLPDRKTKQNRIKQLSFQHTHTHILSFIVFLSFSHMLFISLSLCVAFWGRSLGIFLFTTLPVSYVYNRIKHLIGAQ